MTNFAPRSSKQPRGEHEKSFAAQLNFAMEKGRFTPTTLAEMVGISPAAIRNYLLAQFLPKPPVLAKLERVLQVRFEMRNPAVTEPEDVTTVPQHLPAPEAAEPVPLRLTIAEAKAALARSLGVSPADIEIIVRG